MTFLYVLIFPALDFGLVDLPAVSRASDGTPMVLNYSRWVSVRGGVRLGLAEVELGNPLTSLPSPSHPPFGEAPKLGRTLGRQSYGGFISASPPPSLSMPRSTSSSILLVQGRGLFGGFGIG